MNDIVIGSGPAGLSAAMALLARGRSVTMLDVGKTLEPEAEARRANLAAAGPEDWSAEDLDAFTGTQDAAADEIQRYGSPFAVETADTVFADAPRGFELRSSGALGGLSNVWGSAALPWRGADMAGWPVTADDLAPHYRAVTGFMPVAGEPGHMDSAFPEADIPLSEPLPATPQGKALLRRFDRASAAWKAQGITVGPARQAVAGGCRQCGLCLYGCPYALIFSTRTLVTSMAADGRLTYRKARVARLSEDDTGVTAHLDGETDTVSGEKAYLATGVLETARLQFASDPALAGQSVTLKESAHFFTPHLQSWGARGTGKGPLHTLVQAFVEIDTSEISPYLVHSQLYGWNDFYARELKTNYGRGIAALNPVFEALARRLIVAQTFLHSDHCPEIALSAAKDDPKGRLKAEIRPKEGFDARVTSARRVLARALRKAGLYAIMPAGRTGAPGSSFHVGGSFPMSENPRPGQTDTLGRPPGWRNLHIVDASVLPSIPASTITFSVMANAHRIASHG